MRRLDSLKSSRSLLLVLLLAAGAIFSLATSSRRRTVVVAATSTVELSNPFPTGAFARLVGPTVRLYYLPPYVSRTIVVPSGTYRLYWRRPSYMRFYNYYRLYYFAPGSFTRWKIGMI